MQLVGHRGARGEAPENTLAGIQHALNLGVTHFEVDIRLSKDDKFFLIHDASLKRTCADARYLHELDADTISHIFANKDSDACYYKAKSFPQENSTTAIPSLDSVFDLLAELQIEKKCSFQLEIKSDEYTNSEAIINEIIQDFPAQTTSALPCDIVFTSFDGDIIRCLKERAPHLHTGIIAYEEPNKALELAEKLKCTHCCLQYELVLKANDSQKEKLQSTTLHISTWTVNDPSLVDQLTTNGVNSVITDKPSLFI